MDRLVMVESTEQYLTGNLTEVASVALDVRQQCIRGTGGQEADREDQERVRALADVRYRARRRVDE